jgi:hypothetical protein
MAMGLLGFVVERGAGQGRPRLYNDVGDDPTSMYTAVKGADSTTASGPSDAVRRVADGRCRWFGA